MDTDMCRANAKMNPSPFCGRNKLHKTGIVKSVKFVKVNSVSLVLVLLIGWMTVAQSALANNVDVSNVSLTSVSVLQGTAKAQFDIAWGNSWRDATNYDAVWVFVKYSTDAGVTWNHATLKTSGTNPAGFSQGTGTGLDILVPSDKKGAFLQRSATGAGNVSTTAIKLVWDYAGDGVLPTATARVKVFAIEMVYIPTGAFYAGSGGTETSAFYAYPTTTNAYLINSEGAITVGTTAGNLYYPLSANGGDQTGPIPAAFPKGYNAFYMMKYEISEGQWVDFFNTLTSAQKTTRDITDASGKNSDAVVSRNTVSWTTGDAITTRPDRACNYLSWADGAAYSDWAALRPMTELEFEKAARGTIAPVANEYAWGSTSITAATTISGAENGTETITNAGANCAYNNTTFTGGDAGTGPLRCGIFATVSSTRQTSGAGYYGNMELSGNLWERSVTVGNPTGRAFAGGHGDGALNASGDANVADWPITNALGAGFRSGSWDNAATRVCVSDRYSAAETYATRGYDDGGRCVRTSP